MEYLKGFLIWAVICFPVAGLNGYFDAPVWFVIASSGVAGIVGALLALKKIGL